MVRRIIHIDREKCNGCGLCASACHEGAIDMIDGKARLVRENFCDGLGDCLPGCPTGAITFEEREAPAYDEAAVKASLLKEAREKTAPAPCHVSSGGCPGSRMMRFDRSEGTAPDISRQGTAPDVQRQGTASGESVSGLAQWPCQIKLVPVRAPFFDGAGLLIAADCTAYACAQMHERFMRGRVTLIGCPKLDEGDYTEKLTAIIRENDIKSVTIVRMEVPCCGGLQRAAGNALRNSGKFIPWQVVTISRDGQIIE